MTKSGNINLRVGVTGGIGSGKTSVGRVFNVLGIPVFSADLVAREIMNENPEIIRRINSLAGFDLYPEGSLDREKLASLIFNDQSFLDEINSLVHPVIFEQFISWADKQTSPYVIIEAAILFESGFSMLVDKVITVVAPLEQRVERVIKRNNLSRDQVMERVRNQMDDESRAKLSDYVISNSENEMIVPAIVEIHKDIIGHLTAHV